MGVAAVVSLGPAASAAPAALCRDWARDGQCRFGARCRFEHAVSASSAPQPRAGVRPAPAPAPAAAPAPASQQERLRSRQLVTAALLEVRGWIAPLSKLVLEYRGAGQFDSKAQTLTGHTSSVRAVAVVDAQRVVSGSEGKTLKVWDLESGRCVQTLTGHSSYVFAVAVVDAQRVVSGSGDGTLKVWVEL